MKHKKLDFTVREYQGAPIYAAEGDVKRTFKQDELHAGQKIAIPSLMSGYHLMEVVEEDGEMYATDGAWRAMLEFAKDERACWLCVAMINMRGDKKP
jgi:hypothetical protein